MSFFGSKWLMDCRECRVEKERECEREQERGFCDNNMTPRHSTLLEAGLRVERLYLKEQVYSDMCSKKSGISP